jgi:surfeit locus 1 family protein
MTTSQAGARSRLIPAVFTIVAVLLCGGLGAWQVERLQWKTELIAARGAALAAPATAPPTTLAEARNLEFHPVTAAGTLVTDKETYIHAIGPKGELGFDVVTPLRDGDGRVILVDRGFVPADKKEPASRVAANPGGTTQIQGFLRLAPAAKPGWFIPDNQPQTGEWFWLDLPAIAAADGIPNAAPFYIQAGPTPNRGSWPRGRAPDPADLPNNHLQYAITWFSLAVAAAVIYLLSQRRASRTTPTPTP